MYTGLTLHKSHNTENPHIKPSAAPASADQQYAVADLKPGNESLLSSYFSHPHWGSYPANPYTEQHEHGLIDPSQQQHNHHHWHLPHFSPLHAHPKTAHPWNRPLNEPDVDIRETKAAYYIDVELPGVSDRSSIAITWVSRHSFVVEGLVARLEVEPPPKKTTSKKPETINEWGDLSRKQGDSDLGHSSANVANHSHDWKKGPTTATPAPAPAEPAMANGNNANAANGDGATINGTAKPAVGQQQQPKPQPWHDVVVVNERRIGAYSRVFYLPCIVVHKQLRAKLQDGLLSIMVPKSEEELEGLDWMPIIG